ncbi:acriflavin resistance protein [Oceaniovalibus guishaninsula JLT2003]|uniref:Acriflavin resistance protein n=1 Tax=Oceaniovalibus guishaninsula JLT2003 TaxID=1231392 RepID=K2I4D5_9RHOB|nr:efflux RND transporter permease subunit [Oceaniovalibus guishaninsula]EKE43730.1 acriflavin resistance protein [Oceaniovalibus guishaninsula JLT2003]
MRTLPAAGILGYFVRHRTAANLLLALMVVLGLAAFPLMRAQFFPDVVLNSVEVSVVWTGAGADDVEGGIVEMLEPALLNVEGVESGTSSASEGVARIELEFEPGWDMGRAVDEVEAAIDAAGELPEGAEDAVVRRSAWRDRVTDVVITGPVGIDQLGRIADEFVARLFRDGVPRATIRGIAAPEVVVEVPTLALIRENLTMADIAAAIRAEADTAPAGDIDGGARVRTGVERRTAEDVGGVVLRALPDGTKLRIADVARVIDRGPSRDEAYFVGDNPAVTVRVDRSDRGDAIDIERQVRAVADDLALELPPGVTLDLIRGRAEMISGRLELLLNNGIIGFGLVVTLLFLFLNARTAFWVAAGIPVAMIAAIGVMYAAGLTLNMISLFALILTLGIVVDDAIVVGEHADYRARMLGEAPPVAAANAATRMFAPVFSATLTTVIAFFALVAIKGRFGRLIADIPFTVIAVLLASLVECFLILPHHMAHALAHSARSHWYDWPSRQVNRGFGWVRDRAVRPLIRLVVAARYPVLAGALVLLAGQAALYVRGDVQWRFFDSPEQGSITGNFAMAPGATRADTVEMLAILQRATTELGARYAEEYGLDPVDYSIGQIGGTAGRGLSGTENTDDDLLGGISIELIDADLRPYSSFEFVAALQDAVPRHPRLEQISFRRWGGGPGGDAIDVQLSGADSAILKDAAEKLKARLAQFPEVSALEDTLAYDKQELVVELTPLGRALGLDIDGLGRVLRNRLGGIEAATFAAGQREASIRVELPEDELTADFLGTTFLPTASGLVRLADVVTVDIRDGFSTIRRENGVRVVSVTGDLADDDAARAAEITRIIEGEILPELEREYGIATDLSGLREQENDFLTDAGIGFGLCLIGIFLTLAWIFASWTRPVVVMAVIPFGLVGAVWGHYVWDIPITMFSVVGLIGMTGIVINDSIVLVTTIDEYARDRGLAGAIVDGVCDRLRPVMLTTLTTVLGLMPLLYERSAQAQFLKPTVVTLVYGLGFGFFMVLLVVPALMAMQHDAARQLRALRRALAGRRRGPQAILAAAALVLAVLFAATFGPVLAGGAPLVTLGDRLGDGPVGALAAFLAGAAMLLAAIWLAAAALHVVRGRRVSRTP